LAGRESGTAHATANSPHNRRAIPLRDMSTSLVDCFVVFRTDSLRI
jgi:hypothetical protein